MAFRAGQFPPKLRAVPDPKPDPIIGPVRGLLNSIAHAYDEDPKGTVSRGDVARQLRNLAEGL